MWKGIFVLTSMLSLQETEKNAAISALWIKDEIVVSLKTLLAMRALMQRYIFSYKSSI